MPAVSPQQVQATHAERKKKEIPEQVFEAFNSQIALNYSARSSAARIKQDDVIQEIVKSMGVSRGTIFDNHWLDVEPIYEAEGWIVKYDKPAYNETYPATFTFEDRSKGH